MNIPLKAIVDYIKSIYKPDEMSVNLRDYVDEKPEYILFLYFNHIDDSYVTNPDSNDVIKNKEKNLEKEIRKDIYNFFSTETSGLDLKGFAPYKRHGLTIDVIMNRTPKK